MVSLYFIAATTPAWFLPMHTYFVPSLLIIVMALFFVLWTTHATPDFHSPDTA
jgi:hypothetical protein